MLNQPNTKNTLLIFLIKSVNLLLSTVRKTNKTLDSKQQVELTSGSDCAAQCHILPRNAAFVSSHPSLYKEAAEISEWLKHEMSHLSEESRV